MKKIFTTVAMALASCAFAVAQIPAHFNYQGVCDAANATIEVTFNVVNAEDEVVYTEVQTCDTNDKGLFTAKVGIEDEWAAIDWTEEGLKLQTEIYGEVVAECEFAAVPYAKVAQRYVGQEYIENDLQDLIENQRMLAKAEDLIALSESYEQYTKDLEETLMESFGETYNELEALKAQVDGAYEQLQGLMGEDGYLNTAFASVENQLDNIDMQLQPLFREVYGGEVYVEATDETIEVVGLKDIVNNLEEDVFALRTLPVQVTAIETILNGTEAYTIEDEEEGTIEVPATDGLIKEVAQVTNLAQSLSEDLYTEETGLVDQFVAAQEKLTDVAAIAENAYMGAEAAHKALFGDDETDGLVDQFAIVSSDVQEVAGLANTVKTIQVTLDGFAGDEEEGIPAVKGLVEKVDDLANITENAYMGAEASYKVLFGDEDTDGLVDQFAVVSSDVQEVAGLANTVKTIQVTLDGFEGDEETPAVDGLVAKVAQVTNLAQSLSEDIYTEETGLAYVVADLVELDLPNVVENLEVMTPMLQKMEEDIEAVNGEIKDVRDKIGEVALFQQTFDEEYMTTISDAIAEVDGKADTALEQVNLLGAMLDPESESEEAVYNKIAAVNAAIADVYDKIGEVSKFQQTFDEEYMSTISEYVDAADADLKASIDDIYEKIGEIALFQQTFDEEYMSQISEYVDAADEALKAQIDAIAETVQEIAENPALEQVAENAEEALVVSVTASSQLNALVGALVEAQVLTEEQAEAIMSAGAAQTK